MYHPRSPNHAAPNAPTVSSTTRTSHSGSSTRRTNQQSPLNYHSGSVAAHGPPLSVWSQSSNGHLPGGSGSTSGSSNARTEDWVRSLSSIPTSELSADLGTPYLPDTNNPIVAWVEKTKNVPKEPLPGDPNVVFVPYGSLLNEKFDYWRVVDRRLLPKECFLSKKHFIKVGEEYLPQAFNSEDIVCVRKMLFPRRLEPGWRWSERVQYENEDDPEEGLRCVFCRDMFTTRSAWFWWRDHVKKEHGIYLEPLHENPNASGSPTG
jgi:hypothetical protein